MHRRRHRERINRKERNERNEDQPKNNDSNPLDRLFTNFDEQFFEAERKLQQEHHKQIQKELREESSRIYKLQREALKYD